MKIFESAPGAPDGRPLSIEIHSQNKRPFNGWACPVLLLFVLSLSACGGGGGGEEGEGEGGDVENSSAALTKVIMPGAECAAGGIQVDSGIDDNGNGLLDAAEVDTSETICNGVNGADGLTALVEQTVFTAGVSCSLGGVRFDVGLDNNGNGILDPSEINSSEFLCNSGVGNTADNEPPAVVSAISISNTEVLVQFSEPVQGFVENPVDGDAENPVHYSIVTQVPETQLPVWDAAFANADHSTVLLSTFSQSSVGYRLTVANIRDLDGNPIAEPTILIDPSSAEFVGTDPSGATVADSDGDTLPDHTELIGWDVTITYGNGTTETWRVTSDPGDPNLPQDDAVNIAARDTDGEGVTDNEEKHGGIDPRQPDTDGDTLTDNEEWNIIYSDPSHQDTDGDGTQDGFEFYSFRTSPVLADTDGDQINDTDEILASNRDPRVADLPRAGISVGEVRLLIDERFTFEDAQGETVTVESNSTSTLSLSENETFANSDTDVTQHVTGGRLETGFEGKGGRGTTFLGGAFLNIEGSFQHTDSETKTTSRESAIESQRVHEQSLRKVNEFNTTSTVTREVFGASIDVDLIIRNTGDIAFAISNLEVTVLQRDRQSTGRFVPVATLIPNSTLITGTPAVFNLGPFTPERGPILFSSRDVFPALVEQLMAAPGGLIFKVANFDMTDELGRVISFANQAARDRTAGIIVDFGDGEAQRSLVATALQPDVNDFISPNRLDLLGLPPGSDFVGGFNADGSPKGIPLDFALQDILGLTKNATRELRIIAGANGIAESAVQGDDIQLIPVGTIDVNTDAVVVSAGPDGVLSSGPVGDDEVFTQVDGIVAGPNRTAESIADGDDVQLVPFGTTGLGVGTVVVSAGQDGILDSIPGGVDDVAEVTNGYETSLTCNAISTNAGNICSVSDIDCACSGPEILVRFGGHRNGDLNRVWVAFTNSQVPAGADFGEVTLKPGTDLFLAFVQDLDEDGIFAREEYLSGSTDSRADVFDNAAFGEFFDENDPSTQGTQGPDTIPDSSDTDRDGIGDFAEIRIGWKVTADGGPLRQVFSSPRLRDSDGDGLLDPVEQDLRRFCSPADPRIDGLCAFQSTPVLIGDAVAIIAGPNGIADSIADAGDEQLITQGVTGLSYSTPIVGAGSVAGISTDLLGDDLYESLNSIPPASDPGLGDTDFDGLGDFAELNGQTVGVSVRNGPGTIGVGQNGIAPTGIVFTQALGDDIQIIPPWYGLGGSLDDVYPLFTIVVAPGFNRILDTPTLGSDVIVPSFAETRARGDDIQVASFGNPVQPGGIVILPGPNGIIDSCVDRPVDLVDEAGCNGIGSLGEVLFSGIEQLDDYYREGTDVFTDPLRRDTDSDLVADGREIAQGGDPTDPSDGQEFRDSDQDGLTDGEEAELGWFVARTVQGGVTQTFNVLSNPSLPDSDFDGLPDLIERDERTHPNETDTDGDGLTDFNEYAEFERYFGFEQQFPRFFVDGSRSAQHGTDPRLFDTDGDGLSDSEEMQEYSLFVPGEAQARRITSNPLDPDTDADLRNDFDERNGGIENIITDASDPDTDDDGRTDFREINATPPTDPLVPDLQVTVRFQQLQLNGAGIGLYDLEWDFHVATDGEFPGFEVSDEQFATFFPWSPCLAFPSSGLGRIRNLGGGTTFLDSSVLGERTFSLSAGQGFILNGNVNDVNSCDTGALLNYDCKSKFFKAIQFEDLAQNGFTTETLALTQTAGSCGPAEIVYTISIE